MVFCLQAWVLSKVQIHRSTLKSMIVQACDMVHRDQFTQCLITLGIKTVEQPLPATEGASSAAAKPSQPTKYAQVYTISFHDNVC